MPEWLQSTADSGPESPAWILALRLVCAFALGGVVAGIYRYTRRKDIVAPTFPSTLVLVTILIAMVTQVIGDQLARAFSLVGVLSIVRFRTVVEDTFDIAFVIFAVVVGMAVGANHFPLALIGITVVGLAAVLVHPRRSTSPWVDRESSLLVRIGIGRDADTLLQAPFQKYLTRFQLVSGSSSRQGSAFDLTYKVRLRSDCQPTALLEEINRIEGIQSVELRRE